MNTPRPGPLRKVVRRGGRVAGEGLEFALVVLDAEGRGQRRLQLFGGDSGREEETDLFAVGAVGVGVVEVLFIVDGRGIVAEMAHAFWRFGFGDLDVAIVIVAIVFGDEHHWEGHARCRAGSEVDGLDGCCAS